MKPAAWAVIAVAAVVAAVAWRHARRSRLALVIALVATALAGCGLVFAAGGWSGCSDRGDCGSVGSTLRTILITATLLLPVLLLLAGARALWRRLAPERPAGASRPRARGDAARMRPRDLGLALCGLVFGLVGVATLVTGSGEDRLTGLAVTLFALALLLVPLSGRLAARSGLRPRLDRVGHDGRLEHALVIPGSRAKQRLMLLACLCFAAAGLVMAVWPEALASSTKSPGTVRIGGILCALAFGAGGAASLLLARGPMRIDLLPGGIRWQLGTEPSFVAWDAITGVAPYEIHDTWFLGLDAEPGGLRVPQRQRWLAGASRAVSGDDASIALEAFPVEPERLAEVVAACAEDPERRAELVTDAGLTWLRDGVPPARVPAADRAAVARRPRAVSSS